MNKIFFIAIGGGSASGKTTVAKEIRKSLGKDKTVILELDSYYKDFSYLSIDERERINFDHPDTFDIELLQSHLFNLERHKSIEKPSYDYTTHSRMTIKNVISPKQYIIVEGLFTLVFDRLFNIFNFKIYVDTADDIRILRRIKRDIDERGRSIEKIIEQYLSAVRPMHKSIIDPSRKNSDIILNWDEYNLSAIRNIVSQIERRLRD